MRPNPDAATGANAASAVTDVVIVRWPEEHDAVSSVRSSGWILQPSADNEVSVAG